MTISLKSLAVAASLIVLPATFAIVPSSVSAMTFPTLSFPEAGTSWGCHFNGTCNGATVSTNGRD